jgi:hypothetical protein
MAQQLRVPDTESQRTEMKRLAFLIGKWAGEARLLRGSGEQLELNQNENAEYKLGGLILTIEGIGRSRIDDKVELHAFAIVSYDDETQAFHMRAYNDGRYLESDLKLLEDGRGFTWGFALGDIKTSSTLQMNENGDWTELTEIAVGSQPWRKLVELKVSPQK